ncbi:MAG: OprD family outer membrane porin, partial [Candidatus Limnocylindria bacterium]
VQYASGWLLDTFAIGATYYTSLPLYTPDDRLGTLLLTPDHDAIGVVGEAWGALRYKDYALLKAYRQRIDDGYINSQDNRMVPNTFEAVTLSGAFDWLRYDVGYLWRIKPRDSNDFISMSQQAGAGGGDEGLILTSLAFAPTKDLLLYVGNYYAHEVFNTTFAKGEYMHTVSPDLKVLFGLQFTDQRDVGDQRLGEFNTWNVGAGARILFKGLSVGAATHFTGDEASIRSPWGSWPGYLSLMVTDFDRANEKAFGVGVKYDFGGTLLASRLPGLTVHLLYAQGRDREDPATGASQPTTHEGDLDITYNVPQVKGLSLRFRNAYVGRGDASTLMDFRLIVNYELDLL